MKTRKKLIILKGVKTMKKYVVLATLLTVVAAHGFKRECKSGPYASNKKKYTYSVDILSAQEMPVICFVTLTDPEKAFIRQALAGFTPATKVTREFYLENIKKQYKSKRKFHVALRRVARDFGGSEKQGRKIHTVGDILKMLDGNLKDIGTKQIAF
jgi:hypothetical protein